MGFPYHSTILKAMLLTAELAGSIFTWVIVYLWPAARGIKYVELIRPRRDAIAFLMERVPSAKMDAGEKNLF